jgi:hypothetical protein
MTDILHCLNYTNIHTNTWIYSDNHDDHDTYDLSNYIYLHGTTHYDHIDNGVFRVTHIKAEDFNDGNGMVVVVYRSQFNEGTRRWEKTNMNDPIMVADIMKYHHSAKNKATMATKLQAASSNSKCNQSNSKSNQLKK